MTLLNKSIPYYIRCIKPNNNKRAQEFDAKEVLRQMKCAGLQEAIRIRKAGYEIRIKHEQFVKRYRFISKQLKSTKNSEWLKEATNMFTEWLQTPELGQRMQKEKETQGYQIGKTKVFMKEALRNFLDQRLIDFQMKYLIKLQKSIKKFAFRIKVRRNLKKFLSKMRKISRLAKQFIFRRRLQRLFLRKNALKKMMEVYKQKKLMNQFQKMKKIIIHLKNQKYNQQLAPSSIEQTEKRQINRFEEQEVGKSTIINSLEESIFINIDAGNNLIYETQNLQSQKFIPEQQSHPNQSGSRPQQQERAGGGYTQLKQFIKELEQKLTEEQQNRRLAEQKVQDLEIEIKNLTDVGGLRFSVMPRDTLSQSNFGAQLDDLLSYERLSKEVSQLKTSLEQLQTEKNIQEKRLNRKILEVTQQLEVEKQSSNQVKQQMQNLIDEKEDINSQLIELQEENQSLLNDFLNDKKRFEQQEKEWEMKIREEREKWMQKEDQDKKKLQQSLSMSNSQSFANQEHSKELEKEKRRRIDLETENERLTKLYQHYKELVESEQFEVVSEEKDKKMLQEQVDAISSENIKQKSYIKQLEQSLQKNQQDYNVCLQQKENEIKQLVSQTTQGLDKSTFEQKLLFYYLFSTLKSEKDQILMTLKQREQKNYVQDKIIQIMTNLIKLKMLEVQQLHKFFGVTEEKKKEVYKEIEQIMSKEKALMKKFEECIKLIKQETPQPQEEGL